VTILVGHEVLVCDVCYAPNGLTLATASGDKSIRVWDSKNGRQLHVLHGHTEWVNQLRFSSQGDFIASCR
jgi:WD40 repeat protein